MCKVPSPRGAAATVLTTNKCRDCFAVKMQLCPECREGAAWPSYQQTAFCSFLGPALGQREEEQLLLMRAGYGDVLIFGQALRAVLGVVPLVRCLGVVSHCVNFSPPHFSACVSSPSLSLCEPLWAYLCL